METGKKKAKRQSSAYGQARRFLQRTTPQQIQRTSGPGYSSIIQPRFDSVKFQPFYAVDNKKGTGISSALPILIKGLKQFYLLTQSRSSIITSCEQVTPTTHPAIVFLKLIEWYEETTNAQIMVRFDEDKTEMLGLVEYEELEALYEGYSFDLPFLFCLKKRKKLYDAWFTIISVITNILDAPSLYNDELAGTVDYIETGIEYSGEDKEWIDEQQKLVDLYRGKVSNFSDLINANNECLDDLRYLLAHPLWGFTEEVELTNSIARDLWDLVKMDFSFLYACYFDEEKWNATGYPAFDYDRYAILWDCRDHVYELNNELWSDTANNTGVVPFSDMVETRLIDGEVIVEDNGMKEKLEIARKLYLRICDFSIMIEKKYGITHETQNT